MTATMPLSTASKIYTNTIQELRGFIDTHLDKALYQQIKQTAEQVAAGAPVEYYQGISAFGKAYGIDRSNLTKCLNGHREMSVGLYQRVAVALGLLAADQACDEEMLLNVPLRMYLMINHDAIKNSIMMVNFS